MDIEKNEIIKKNFVPGLKVGKVGLEKSLEEKLLALMISKDMKLMLMAEELVN